jgi:hypothetical protein
MYFSMGLYEIGTPTCTRQRASQCMPGIKCTHLRWFDVGMNMQSRVPPYFDFLIERVDRGMLSRCVHLGHWDQAPPLDTGEPPQPEDIERAVQRLNQVLLDMATVHDGQRVLDVGCGFGATLQHINERF